MSEKQRESNPSAKDLQLRTNLADDKDNVNHKQINNANIADYSNEFTYSIRCDLRWGGVRLCVMVVHQFLVDGGCSVGVQHLLVKHLGEGREPEVDLQRYLTGEVNMDRLQVQGHTKAGNIKEH